jgi:hypothetical protein
VCVCVCVRVCVIIIGQGPPPDYVFDSQSIHCGSHRTSGRVIRRSPQ